MPLAGNFVYNVALGRCIEWAYRVDNNDPANSAFIVVVLEYTTLETKAVLQDKATLAAVLSGATNEVTNTGYARKTITDADITFPSPDNTGNKYDFDIPDQVWSAVSAGDEWGAFLLCFDYDTTSGTDSNIIPVLQVDFHIVPDGTGITGQIAAAGIFEALPV